MTLRWRVPIIDANATDNHFDLLASAVCSFRCPTGRTIFTGQTSTSSPVTKPQTSSPDAKPQTPAPARQQHRNTTPPQQRSNDKTVVNLSTCFSPCSTAATKLVPELEKGDFKIWTTKLRRKSVISAAVRSASAHRHVAGHFNSNPRPIKFEQDASANFSV